MDYIKSGFGEDSHGKPAVDTGQFCFPSEEGSMQPKPGLLTYSGFPSRSWRLEAVQPSEAQASWVSKSLFLNDKHIFRHEIGFLRFEHSYTLPRIQGYPVQTDNEGGHARWLEETPMSSFSMFLHLSAPQIGLYDIKQ